MTFASPSVKDDAPAVWTYARNHNPNVQGLPNTYQTFQILRNGVAVGSLKWDRSRWKNCGGPAWKGTLFPIPGAVMGCGVVFYHSRQPTVLAWFKTEWPMRMQQAAIGQYIAQQACS